MYKTKGINCRHYFCRRHESGVDETTSFMGDGNGTTLSNISGISGLNNIPGSNNDPNEIRRASLRYWNDDNQVTRAKNRDHSIWVSLNLGIIESIFRGGRKIGRKSIN